MITKVKLNREKSEYQKKSYYTRTYRTEIYVNNLTDLYCDKYSYYKNTLFS